jgi:glutaredoxin
MFMGCGLLFMTSCNQDDDIMVLSQEDAYFFYQETCPHCHIAADYIKERHPDMRVKALDIKMPGNRRLFESAVKGYKIKGAAGTPLICFGRNYIMGWSDEDPARFDEYAKDYE